MSIQHARNRRRAKARELARLETGELGIRSCLRSHPPALEGVDIYDVLMRVPGLGREGVRDVLQRVGLWPHTHMRDVTRTEFRAIAEALPARYR